MSLTKDVTHTIPDTGNRESVMTEFANGSGQVLYRVTDTGNETHAATFTGADILAAFDANAAYLDAWKTANPSITTGAQAAALLLSARTLLKAYGDAACGFS